MSELVTLLAEGSAALLEAMGIGVMTLIAVYASVHAVIRLLRKEDSESVFTEVRQRLGKGILLGLEFLIAADVIHIRDRRVPWPHPAVTRAAGMVPLIASLTVPAVPAGASRSLNTGE